MDTIGIVEKNGCNVPQHARLLCKSSFGTCVLRQRSTPDHSVEMAQTCLSAAIGDLYPRRVRGSSFASFLCTTESVVYRAQHLSRHDSKEMARRWHGVDFPCVTVSLQHSVSHCTTKYIPNKPANSTLADNANTESHNQSPRHALRVELVPMHIWWIRHGAIQLVPLSARVVLHHFIALCECLEVNGVPAAVGAYAISSTAWIAVCTTDGM